MSVITGKLTFAGLDKYALPGNDTSLSSGCAMRVFYFLALCLSPAAYAAIGPFPHGPNPPSDASKWTRDLDAATSVLRAHQVAAVYARVVVRPDGRVQSCQPIVRAEQEFLTFLSCRVLMERAIYEPAEDMAGHSVYGTTVRWMVWAKGDDGAYIPSKEKMAEKLIPDIEISVDAIPAEIKDPADVYINIAVRPDGSTYGCAPQLEGGGVPQSLVKLACQQAGARTWTAATDRAGVSVSSVQRVLVRFSVASS